MAALSANRDTREVVGALVSLTVEDATTIYAGALVAVNASGKAVPASDASGLKVIGRAEHQTGEKLPLLVKRGVFLYANKDNDLLTVADIGSYCYVADDQTVQATVNSNGIVAGLVRGVTADGVYVDTTMNPDGATAGAAAAASTVGAAVASAVAIAIAAGGNVRLVEAPDAADSDGVKGDIAIDAASIYLCIDTKTWVKADLAFDTWGA